ncbi:protein JOKA2-like [Phragmites australis]|uniref:protein JOKA2-like n=1 Tax=Phragmites australis TaxID=29695 RepID=UPI002D791F37|nr:protein JOKA2-like [Phragmites australis]XP_062222890.1 protein JOKA2-like [Phragmites australis]
MSDRSSPAAPSFFPFDPQPEAWDVTFKVKYGDTLKRFYGYVNGTILDINLPALRAKIASAFKFGPDADFILTYTDEDGDVVMLDDDDDLRDAALHQKLNPLRINVQLKSSHPTEQQDTNSAPVKPTAQDPLSQIISAIEAMKPISSTLSSPAQEERLAQMKSAVGEAIKSIPEPVPDALAKLSHEVLDAVPPPLTDLIKPLLQLITPSNSSNGPSVHADGSSSSSSVVTQTQMPAKAKDEPKARESFGSRSVNAQKSESSEARGLRSVLGEAAAPAPAPNAGTSQDQQPSLYPSVEELLFPTNSVDKSVCKGNQSEGKSVISSAMKPAPPVPTLAPPPPPPSISEWFQPRRCQPHPWQSEANAKAISDSRWRIPMYKVPHAPPTPPAPLHHTPPGYGPSPRFPYPGRLLSSGHLYGDLSNNTENSAPRSLHRWIQCDGCGVQPIVGPRYKSNVKEDYDLCDSCFQRMGNEVEYTKIDKPILPHRLLRDSHAYRKVHSPRFLMKSKRDKLESRFILDVTVLDGTLMAPSTLFTKIWRMHNNGSTTWPLGTQLIWVGGDQFALQISVPLEIPVNGFPVDKEIDIAVDFVAPARPGRYISYWRLASPSGQKFGQRVWVHIQVEDPSNDSNRNAAINLNLPPESNSTNTINLIDVNMEAADTALSAHAKRTKEVHFHPFEALEPKKPQPAPCVDPSVSAAAPANPTVDVPMSSATASAFVPSVNVPIPEVVMPAVPAPVNVPIMPTPMPVNVPASAPVSASAGADAVAPEPFDIDGHNEEKLLRELEEMGFRQIDLNKEILRQNNYNMEQSVDDLCGANEWDPLLAELEEMGFDDTEMNKELLAKNGGSIKRAVMDLIAREKKDK